MRQVKIIDRDEALVRLESLCVRSEQCSGEILTKLARWRIPMDVAREILDSLVDRRFVDDRRYAGAYVRDKYRFSRWGRRKIRMSLSAKRIDRDVVEAALEEIDDSSYRDVLVGLLKAKARLIAEGNTFEGRTKLFRFAASRGFESDLISQVIRSENLWPELSDE